MFPVRFGDAFSFNDDAICRFLFGFPVGVFARSDVGNRHLCHLCPIVRTARRPEVPDIWASAALRWVAIGWREPMDCPVMGYFAKVFT
jgi:hypothetical protein